MIHDLSEQSSVLNQFVAELRHIDIQKSRLRFRRNLERIGEIFAYEISKVMATEAKSVETSLGSALLEVPDEKIILATVLRAGLPLHQGLLNYFDKADNAFISAYRKHHKDGTFEIEQQYVSCPDLDGTTLIICDPMLATGASMSIAIETLLQSGQPEQVHIVAVIASRQGVEHISRILPEAHIWTAAIDEELTAKSFIVPGLGDAGDLCYGNKLQD